MSVANSGVTIKESGKHTEKSCRPVREILNLVGDKWSILVVVILDGGTKRFSEIQHSIDGISQRMLTRTLRELERYGLVSRRVEPTVPPSVYYSLTPLGKTLLVPVKNLAGWAQDNFPKIQKAQDDFKVKTAKNKH